MKLNSILLEDEAGVRKDVLEMAYTIACRPVRVRWSGCP